MDQDKHAAGSESSYLVGDSNDDGAHTLAWHVCTSTLCNLCRLCYHVHKSISESLLMTRYACRLRHTIPQIPERPVTMPRTSTLNYMSSVLAKKVGSMLYGLLKPMQDHILLVGPQSQHFAASGTCTDSGCKCTLCNEQASYSQLLLLFVRFAISQVKIACASCVLFGAHLLPIFLLSEQMGIFHSYFCAASPCVYM